jgi:hypothetical protein
MGTAATRSAPRITLRRALVSTGVAITSVAALTSCGEGSSEEKKPENPAAGFSGTYQATLTPLTISDKPVDPADEKNKPSTATWIVRSTCDGPGDSCVAVAASTTPTDDAALNRDRMEFVYENGSWTRVVEAARGVCTANATQRPVDELFVGMQSTTLKADGPLAGGPVAAVSGSYESAFGGTCARMARGRVELRRTGELPADTPTLPSMPVAPAVTDPPGASLRGTYDASSKPVSADPPNFMSVFAPRTYRVSFRPMCTRDGARCIAVSTLPDGRFDNALLFTDNAYRVETTGGSGTCTGGRRTYYTTANRVPVPVDAPRPLARATQDATTTFMDPCPATVRLETTLVRIGD